MGNKSNKFDKIENKIIKITNNDKDKKEVKISNNDKDKKENVKVKKNIIETIKSLHTNKNWDELIVKVNKYFVKNIKDLDLISKLLIDLPQENFESFIKNTKINRYTILRLFMKNKMIEGKEDRIKYILKTDPQKYLGPTVNILSLEYIVFLLGFDIKIDGYIILDSIKKRNNYILSLLLNEGVKIKTETKESFIRIYNSFLSMALISNKKDMFITIMNKMSFVEIDFNALFKTLKFLYKDSNKNFDLKRDDLDEKYKDWEKFLNDIINSQIKC